MTDFALKRVLMIVFSPATPLSTTTTLPTGTHGKKLKWTIRVPTCITPGT